MNKFRNLELQGQVAWILFLMKIIKHRGQFLLSFLEKIFNNVLNRGHFPWDWNIGVIKLIYKKKGDKRFPGSYKGITLTSCLGKLFTSI